MTRRGITYRLPVLILLLALGGCGKTAPEAPAGKPHSVTLKWDASTSKVTTYRVYRTADPKVPPGLVAVTAADDLEYVDKSVEAGRTYYYSVKAVGPDGAESDSSEKVVATIPKD